MARTKASVAAKVSFGKSTKAQKSTSQSTPKSSGRSKSSSKPSWSGGNPVCPRETPDWQQPITRFFNNVSTDESGEASGVNKSKRKKNAIVSDSESEDENVNSKSVVEDTDITFNETANSEIDLEPLVDDESSHKIGEYFKTSSEPSKLNGDPTETPNRTAKNKGTGKSSKNRVQKVVNKENHEPNMDVETVLDISKKRLLENESSESIENEVKKIKI